MVTISHKDVVATVSAAGLVIRYTFYLVGALTLALIAIAITTIWGWRARTIDAKPAFRIAAPELARLPMRSKVILSWHGRIETRHYGQIYDRDMDLTVALIMPPNDSRDHHHRRLARHSRHQAVAQSPHGLQRVQSRSRNALRSIACDRRARGHRRPLEIVPDLLQPFRTDDVGARRLVLRRERRQAEPGSPRLPARPPGARYAARIRAKPMRSCASKAARAARCSASPVSQTVDTRSRSSSGNRPSSPSIGRRHRLRASATDKVLDLAVQERILPAAAGGRCARRKRRFQIIQHDLLVLVVERRHAVPLHHQRNRVIPSRARQALRRDQLEIVACRAGIERIVAPRPVRKTLRRFIARGELRRLRGGRMCERQSKNGQQQTKPPRLSRGGLARIHKFEHVNQPAPRSGAWRCRHSLADSSCR